MDIVRLSALKIPIEKINLYSVKEKLTFWTTDFIDKTKLKQEFFQIYDNYIFTPRYFNEELNISEDLVDDKSTMGYDINISDNIKLRNDAQEKAYEFLLNHRSGILKLPPGRGKTVITIKYLSKKQKKFLVFVDTEKLLLQWIERITEFTNIKEDDIGIIRADKFETDKPCSIGMIQTIVSKCKSEGTSNILNKLKEANYGVTIYDEVHTLIGPQFFTNVCNVITSYNTFGLSATPYRTDDRTQLLYYWLSKNMYIDNEYEMQPKVNILLYDSGLFNTKTWSWISYGGQFNRMRYQKQLIKRDSYNETLKYILKTSLENNRNLVLISEIKEILEKTIDKNKNDLPEYGYYVGGSKEEEKYKQFVFTTYKLCNKGIDNDTWDTLVLMTPISSPIMLEQTVGRIVRSKKDKKQPVVLDLVDITYPQVFLNMLNKRLNYYIEQGFEINILNEELLHSITNPISKTILERLNCK